MADENFLSGMPDDAGGDTNEGDQPSFDDTMQQIADELFSEDSDGDDDSATPAPADDATDASEQEAEGAEADETSPDAEADEAGDEGDDEDQTDDDGDGAADKPLSAPDRWSAEDKAQFDALPREAQELVLKRERDVEQHLNQKSTELNEEKRKLSGIADLIEQRREAWALNGMTPDTAVHQLLSLSDYAGRDPLGFIRWFAEQRGLSLDQAGASDDDDTDPRIKSLASEVASLKQSQMTAQQAQAEQERAAVRQAVETFAADSENHPHFEDVQSDIAAMLPSIRQNNPGKSPSDWLQIAYDKAVWANDATREKILAEERKKQEGETRKKSSEAAKKAKKAAGANVRGRPGGGTTEKPKSMEETMREAYDKVASA